MEKKLLKPIEKICIYNKLGELIGVSIPNDHVVYEDDRYVYYKDNTQYFGQKPDVETIDKMVFTFNFHYVDKPKTFIQRLLSIFKKK